MNRPFLAWPGWHYLGFAGLLSALNGLWFGLVYVGCDWITAQRTLRLPIHLPIELSIPLVPGAVLAYMSIYPLFWIGPFIVREGRDFVALIRSLALATLIGGIGFLLIPGQLAYAPPGDLGIWANLFHLADRWNLDYNFVPSLHVGLSVCCVMFYARGASSGWRIFLWAWAGGIALSTILTHQHHVIDAVTGWLLGVGVSRFAMGRIEARG